MLEQFLCLGLSVVANLLVYLDMLALLGFCLRDSFRRAVL